MLRSAYGMSRPSVDCNVVAPYRQRLKLFGNIFA